MKPVFVRESIHQKKLAFSTQAVLDTRNHPNGVYIYEIVQNGKQVLNGKIIVSR